MNETADTYTHVSKVYHKPLPQEENSPEYSIPTKLFIITINFHKGKCERKLRGQIYEKVKVM
jgi:hypothetical protein